MRLSRLVTAGALLLALAAFAPGAALAQGCSQCRESVGQAPLQTQSAYRKAIFVLVLAAGGVFSGAAFVFRRFR